MGYVVVYKCLTQCCRDGVSTWAKFDGHIYNGYHVICVAGTVCVIGVRILVCVMSDVLCNCTYKS